MAGAAPKLEAGDSRYQDQSRVVACPRSVILGLRVAVLESFTSGPHGGAEVYGILYGTHGGHEVRIAEFQPIAFQSALAGTIPLSEEERRAFAAALGPMVQKGDPKGLEPVGWFRAHPHSELSLTARDLEIAGTFFPEPHQVVMILRPSDVQQSLVRFFYRESGGILKPESPFCEFSVPPALDAPPLVDVSAARAAQTDAADNLGQAPAAPEIETPGDAAEQDGAVMPSLEPPPVQRRHISLVWPMVLATAIGTLVAWYWLTRTPPVNLGLKVQEAGGQLQITWEPVANGEAGNLEITDGGTQLSIALGPDQLRNGKFSYTRHSESVQVNLTALRRSGEPLVETVNFLGKTTTPTDVNTPPTGSASREAPKPSDHPPSVAEKPREFVVSVPLTTPGAARRKFNAPVASASRSAAQATDLAAPPVIAESLPPSIATPVQRFSPPAENLAPPPKPAVAPAPPPAATPVSGRLIWVGHLPKNQEIAINGKSCSTGTLTGELPGKPVKISISPGDLSNDGMVLYTANSQYANSVIEPPSTQNGWRRTTYTWNPKYANDVTVKEAASLQNQWKGMVLLIRNPKISVVVIDWALAN